MAKNLPAADRKVSDFELYKRLLTYVWPFKRFFFLSLFGFGLYAAIDVLLADLLQFIIDTLGGTLDLERKNGVIVNVLANFVGLDVANPDVGKWVIPLLILGFAFVRSIGSFMGSFFLKYVGSHVVFELRQQIFDKLVHVPISEIEKNASGTLVSRVTYNVNQVTGAVTNAITIVFRDGLTVIALFSYLLYINWQLTLTFLVVAPFIALIVRLVSKRFRLISTRLQKIMGAATQTVSETVEGNRDLRIYGAQESEKKRFYEVSYYTLSQQMKMAFANAAFSPTIQFLLSIAISILVWIGFNSSIIDSMSGGLFVTFLVAAGGTAKPIRQLSNVLNIIQKAMAAAEDIFHHIDLENEERGNAEATLPSPLQGEVSFEQVSFHYPGHEEQVLSDISFTAKPGQMIALVGGSGGGKTTLMSLLPRFYNASQGKISIDGVEIQSLSLEELRRAIAIVSQQVVLTNDSIMKNIAYGEMSDKTDEQVIAAAKLANAHEFIERMEQGYNTKIGDNGIRLSGGQRQRLAIARALLKDAPILILDEATSALDNDSERLIQQAMEQTFKGKTSFVIAHRLSTIEKADQILVLDHGRIVESGTHQSLLDAQGRYYELHQKSLDNQNADASSQARETE